MKLLYWEHLSRMMVEQLDKLPGPVVFRATNSSSRKKVKPIVEVRRRWVGIGWMDEGPPRGDEPLLVMSEDDPACPKDMETYDARA